MFGSKIVSLQNRDFQLRHNWKSSKEKKYTQENKFNITHFGCKGLALHCNRDILKNGQPTHP